MMQLSPRPETQVFKQTSSGPLMADIFRCPGQSQGCIAFLHGGALLLGSRTDLPKAVVAMLHAERWDIVALDYRVAPEAAVLEIAEDVLDGLNFVRTRFPSAPTITVGYSAGAYLALLSGALGAPSDGIIAFAGYGDLGGEWYYEPSKFFLDYKEVGYVKDKLDRREPFQSTEERIDLYVYLRQKGLWPEFMLGKELAPLTEKLSPIRHLSPTFPPTVLVHGDNDCDVPVSTSIEMAAALDRHRVPHKLLVMPGFDHDLFEKVTDSQVAAAWREALSFVGPARK